MSYGKVRFREVKTLPWDNAWQNQYMDMAEGTPSFAGKGKQEPRQEKGEDLVVSEASGETA